MKLFNKMAKMTKKVLALIVAISIIVGSVETVNAVSETIQLGEAPYVKERYIANVGFYHKQTTSGQELYCLNIHKSTAKNTTAKLVKNSNNIDGGIVYILKNGYPNKSITGNKDKDYYITQTAVWWYLDETRGTSNLGEQFKNNGTVTANGKGMREKIKQLVTEAKAHKNDSINPSDAALAISASQTTMTIKDKYYTSGDIKATKATNISEYIVTLTNAPSGTKIEKADGTVTDYNGEFKVSANQSFKVKVPVTALKTITSEITVTAKATGTTQYTAYEYQPTNTAMQNVALLEKVTKNVSSAIKLNIDSSRVTVFKVDTNTKKIIAGAKLVLKDASGNTVASWTSTINGHGIRYLVNKNVTKFTIDDTHRDIKITFENAPKKVVVTITKVDQETNSPLAGAVLVVRDSTGKEVARFTTTTDSYTLTDLSNGTYTVEEESAPAGYIKSSQKVSFTIDDQHLSHQINFVNAKETIVPNTASSSSIILTILGIAILGSGIAYVYKNSKKA